jgi:chromate transporter
MLKVGSDRTRLKRTTTQKNMPLNRKIFFIFARLAITHLSNGYMIIHPLRKALVEKQQMLCEERFDRLVAKAQILPGAFSLNLSAVIGRELNGRKGAVSALLGSSVPLVLLFSLLIAIFSPMRHWSLFHSALMGMRPCIIALLIASAYRLGKQQHLSIAQWIYPIALGLIITSIQLAPIYIVLLVVGTGFVYGKFIQPHL